MFSYIKKFLKNISVKDKLDAISRSQAIIELTLDGIILDANQNFLDLMGYSLSEIVGKHHSLFVMLEHAKSQEYEEFWITLKSGVYQSAVFNRIGKNNKKIWIQGSYNPVKNASGKVYKIIKIATDVTEQKLKDDYYIAQIEAISKSQGIIEFSPTGIILNANQNFLNVINYSLSEIIGKHHSIFIDDVYKNSPEYQDFWASLLKGEYRVGEFSRIGKNQKPVWLQASYNPIFDLEKNVFKIVKYATDITDMVKKRENEKNIIEECLNVLSYLAKGNLTKPMEGEYDGPFEIIKDAINGTIYKLKDMILSIKSTITHVSKCIQSISDGSEDLSVRTQEQGYNLESVAASLEEVSATMRLSADNSKKTSLLAEDSKNVATKGESVVQESVTAMKEIQNSFLKISDIVSLIDEIAFQTNILSLNATIEAARANVSGRGFSVVAKEIRLLANRCQQSSKDIRYLIQESNQHVNNGTGLIAIAGNSLRNILDSTIEVASTITYISEASQEQSIGIEDITMAVTRLEKITQQNASLVNENVSAVQELKKQLYSLENMVEKFKIIEA